MKTVYDGDDWDSAQSIWTPPLYTITAMTDVNGADGWACPSYWSYDELMTYEGHLKLWDQGLWRLLSVHIQVK